MAGRIIPDLLGAIEPTRQLIYSYEGLPLPALYNSMGLPASESADVLIQSLLAVQICAWYAGVIHGDLHPNNFLFSPHKPCLRTIALWDSDGNAIKLQWLSSMTITLSDFGGAHALYIRSPSTSSNRQSTSIGHDWGYGTFIKPHAKPATQLAHNKFFQQLAGLMGDRLILDKFLAASRFEWLMHNIWARTLKSFKSARGGQATTRLVQEAPITSMRQFESVMAGAFLRFEATEYIFRTPGNKMMDTFLPLKAEPVRAEFATKEDYQRARKNYNNYCYRQRVKSASLKRKREEEEDGEDKLNSYLDELNQLGLRLAQPILIYDYPHVTLAVSSYDRGRYGVFAVRPIPQGSIITEVVTLVRKDENEREPRLDCVAVPSALRGIGQYAFCTQKQDKWTWNACMGRCKRSKGWVLVAYKDIKCGEEIVYRK